MINKKYTYAVIGASADPKKYGYQVFQDLIGAGYHVFGINPKAKPILDQKIYPTLSAVPKKIDVAIFVVPPAVTEKILPEVKKLGIKKVWLQPGSESQKTIDFCVQNKIDYIAKACIMIKRK